MKSDTGTQKIKVIFSGQNDFFRLKKSIWPKQMTFFSGFQCHFSSRDVDMEHSAGITVATSISYGWRSKADEGEGGQ